MPRPEPSNHTSSSSSSPSSFSSPPSTHTFSAFLFDMDGTIIDSTPAITKFWTAIGQELGIPASEILKTSHGRRSIDVLALLCPERANWDFVCRAERKIPEIYGDDDDDAVEVPGARGLLEIFGRRGQQGVRWGIVTSGTRGLVEGWLERLGLVGPPVMVTAEEVRVGKPHAEPYVEGAKRLGVVEGEEVLVLEDAPSGVKAGKAAGFRVLAVATTHAVEELRGAGADWIVEDLRSVRVERVDGENGVVTVEIRDALVF